MEYNIEYVNEYFRNKGYTLLNKEYKNMRDKLYYICNKHTELGVQETNFWQVKNYNKQCKECKAEDIRNRERYNIAKREWKFIDICHKNNWVYQGFSSIHSVNYIFYICKSHIGQGVQKIRIDHFLNGVKCPYCNISKGEEKIENFLKSKHIQYQREYIFKDCKNKGSLRFDFYLPKYNALIEYQGIQHYKSIEYMGGMTKYENQINNDRIKRQYCSKNKILLIEISYKDFENIDLILNNILETVETARY